MDVRGTNMLSPADPNPSYSALNLSAENRMILSGKKNMYQCQIYLLLFIYIKGEEDYG